MRKISKDIEGPIDNIIIDIASHYSDSYKKHGYTPNILTTISLIFGIISAFLFYKSFNVLAFIMFIIAYYYDCADGFFARKYNMTTEFGDMYDHISDVSKILLIFSIMYCKNKNKFITFLPIMIIPFMLSLIHLGCQEIIYDTNESPSLHHLSYTCISKPDKIMKFTKYFSTGTFFIIVAIVMLTF